MGNRAVITTKRAWENDGIGIYLHWNGGRDSVEAFLEYCKLRGFRTGDYGLARLTQVIANFIGGGLSVGIDTLWHLDCDNGDNGVYIIDDWEIVDRFCFDGKEQNAYDRNELLKEIDERQPESDRIGEDFFDAVPTDTRKIRVGDIVWAMDWSGDWEKFKVLGLGTDRMVNGINVLGVPYIGRYITEDGEPKLDNINNYLMEKVYRVDKF